MAVLSAGATLLAFVKWLELAKPLIVGVVGVFVPFIVGRVYSPTIKDFEGQFKRWQEFCSEVEELWRLGDRCDWTGTASCHTLLKYVERERQYQSQEPWPLNDQLRSQAHDIADKELGVTSVAQAISIQSTPSAAPDSAASEPQSAAAREGSSPASADPSASSASAPE